MRNRLVTNLKGLRRTVTSTLSAADSAISCKSLIVVLLVLADFRSPDVLLDFSKPGRGIPLPKAFAGFFEAVAGFGMRLSTELLDFLP